MALHMVSSTDTLAQVRAAMGLPTDSTADQAAAIETAKTDNPLEQITHNVPGDGKVQEVNSDGAETLAVEALKDTSAGESDDDETDAEKQTELEAEAKAKAEGQPYEKQAKGARRRDAVARIDDLTAKNHDIQRSLDVANKKLADLETPKEEAKALSAEDEPKPEPVLEDFDTWDEWYKADKAHTIGEAARAGRLEARKVAGTRVQETAEQRQQQEVFGEYKSREASFSKENPDFTEVLRSVDDIRLPDLTQIVVPSAVGPQILYELAKDRPEMERIAKLPQARIFAEVIKIEDRLLAAKKTDGKPTVAVIVPAVPRTPAPVGGVIRTSSSSVNTPLDQLPPAEYRRIRREQRLKQSRSA